MNWEPKAPSEIARALLLKTDEKNIQAVVSQAPDSVRDALDMLVTEEHFRLDKLPWLVASGSPKTVRYLVAYLVDPYYELDVFRKAMVLALCKIRDTYAFEYLRECVSDGKLAGWFFSFAHVDWDKGADPKTEQEFVYVLSVIADMGKTDIVSVLDSALGALLATNKKWTFAAAKAILLQKKDVMLPYVQASILAWNNFPHYLAMMAFQLGWLSELNDESLTVLVKQTNSKEIRDAALERFENPYYLAEVAKSAPDSEARVLAIERLHTPKLLLEVFETNSDDVKVYCALCGKIKHRPSDDYTDTLKARLESKIISVLEFLKSSESHNETMTSYGECGTENYPSTFSNYYARGFSVTRDFTFMVRSAVSFLNNDLVRELSELKIEFIHYTEFVDKFGKPETRYYTIDFGEINSICKKELLER